MAIVDRAREIILDPRLTWQTIKEEVYNIKQLFVNYAAPLALIPAVCGLIGMTLVGIRLPSGSVARAPFAEAFIGGALGYVLHLGGIFVAAWAIARLASLFEAKSDLDLSVKLVVYAMTPAWLVGVFSMVPGLSIISIIAFYSIYLLVLGLPVLLEVPANKVFLFTMSILLTGFIISFIISMILVGTVYGPMYMRMMAV
ncbi:hypothetical protein A3H38_03085 [candidate division WOR-1 bacterium RIFCSPLOWO2_02_FULL_46_20]|uniref:Yip1 domain-containing protein n=2 Tax=Saganbacteria TaxID=1703751 RepID=A0A1F4R8W1_UNCSA|nr:MAG: hypothetical protein A3J44_00835 [candidate division WOR-1 bacterium RIFCSPHIGHO2_02_FULL_45_12]OGC04624.1 MAG: hypothetical protein A3H38_03085 [candidate division WOR-1 bacterium RIFCSPLOWO2_02_FULL_46_20]OGC08873.1 MAG: hypothetical protein A3F86_00320 [candidate division WOR-1 bacterium RIFCSPLOWO2_12_FULL_45_9]